MADPQRMLDQREHFFACVRCTADRTDRRMDGNVASVISLTRHLSVSAVQLVVQAMSRSQAESEERGRSSRGRLRGNMNHSGQTHEGLQATTPCQCGRTTLSTL